MNEKENGLAPMLIGLAGPARSGKDTVADLLQRLHDVERFAYANAVKAGLAAMFGLTDEQLNGSEKEQPIARLGGKSPRQLMQTLGTEWGRQTVSPEVWVQPLLEKWDAYKRGQGKAWALVVTDVRFENEAAAVRNAGGRIWHIERRARPGVSAHISESGLTLDPRDRVIDNNGSLCELFVTVGKQMIRDYHARE